MSSVKQEPRDGPRDDSATSGASRPVAVVAATAPPETSNLPLPPIKTIWDDEYITLGEDGTGWTCGYCAQFFKSKNATKALAHVMKTDGKNVSLCQARIPAKYAKRYEDLVESRQKVKPKRFSIWDDDFITLNKNEDGWTCGFCRGYFKSKNATKALAHVAKQGGKDIRICPADVPDICAERYDNMIDSKKGSKMASAANPSGTKTIWDDEYITLSRDESGWTCGFCNQFFATKNATKALAHVAKKGGQHIRVCTAVIPQHCTKRYEEMIERSGLTMKEIPKKSASKRHDEMMEQRAGSVQKKARVVNSPHSPNGGGHNNGSPSQAPRVTPGVITKTHRASASSTTPLDDYNLALESAKKCKEVCRHRCDDIQDTIRIEMRRMEEMLSRVDKAKEELGKAEKEFDEASDTLTQIEKANEVIDVDATPDEVASTLISKRNFV